MDFLKDKRVQYGIAAVVVLLIVWAVWPTSQPALEPAGQEAATTE